MDIKFKLKMLSENSEGMNSRPKTKYGKALCWISNGGQLVTSRVGVFDLGTGHEGSHEVDTRQPRSSRGQLISGSDFFYTIKFNKLKTTRHILR